MKIRSTGFGWVRIRDDYFYVSSCRNCNCVLVVPEEAAPNDGTSLQYYDKASCCDNPDYDYHQVKTLKGSCPTCGRQLEN